MFIVIQPPGKVCYLVFLYLLSLFTGFNLCTMMQQQTTQWHEHEEDNGKWEQTNSGNKGNGGGGQLHHIWHKPIFLLFTSFLILFILISQLTQV